MSFLSYPDDFTNHLFYINYDNSDFDFALSMLSFKRPTWRGVREKKFRVTSQQKNWFLSVQPSNKIAATHNKIWFQRMLTKTSSLTRFKL